MRACGRASRAAQRGAALFLSLLLLMLLTVTGISAVQVSGLESRMARNAHERLLALQAAEAGLASGEGLLERLGRDAATVAGAADGILPARAYGGLEPEVQAPVWADGAQVAPVLPGVAEAPRFMIEAVTVRADESVVFRVTARGTAGPCGAVVLLQSTYVLDASGGARLSWREL